MPATSAYGKRDHYGSRTRVLAQLVLDYADGSGEIVATGPGWKAHTGPVRDADFLMGETYDARLELTGGTQPGYATATGNRSTAGPK